ncbi:imm11 family protein [Sorangium sp. So ce1153]|uniref:imm11 family protein n=1 Tax=Sorangium sp. So ce1153 TaxID=3133333 RepID=UPI003F6030C6
MYFVLQNPVDPSETLADFRPDPRFRASWLTGARFSSAPPNPLELTWVPENEHGRRVAYYVHGPVLMAKRLIAALEEVGVDNLDTYPVMIRSTKGAPDCHDYLAVNIIGAMDAADMEKSIVLDAPDGPMITVIFESLVIDEQKAAGHLLFRLAQSASTVLVHEKVASHLRARSELGLTLLDPADYVG